MVNKDRLIKTANTLAIVSGLTAIVLSFFNAGLFFSIFKLLTTALIIVPLLFVRSASLLGVKNLIVSALLFCLIGDALLLQDAHFVLGLSSGLMGYILFAVGFIKLGGFNFRWVPLVLMSAIGGSLFFWLQPDLGLFELPVGIYVIVLVFMSWQGISLFLNKPRKAFALISYAVLLFMFSDAIVAINKFKSPVIMANLMILSTYWLSIGLIANSICLILKKEELKTV